MSFSTRLKERREELNLSRIDLAKMLNVTPSAIGNYENAISSPKADILYSLFKALNCDANFLFQDEMNTPISNSDEGYTLEEKELIKKYRTLKECEKNIIQLILNNSDK